MITLAEAIKIAENFRGSKVASASDCGDRWAFNFKDDEVQPATNDTPIPAFVNNVLCARQSLPAFVYKDSGKIEYFLFSFLASAVQKGEITFKPVDLPEETKNI